MEVPGFSSKDKLLNIQECVRELLKAAVQSHVRSEPVDLHNGEELHPLVALKREKEALLLEEIEATVELELREQLAGEPLNADSDTQSLSERVTDVQGGLVKAKSQLNQDNCVLEYLQTQDVLQHLTASPRGRECVSEQSMLVSEVSCCAQQLVELDCELSGVQRERRERQMQCRTLMERLNELQKRNNSEDLTAQDDTGTSQQSLQRRLHEVCLLSHCLQALVLGCGVEWAQDDELRELTLKLGNIGNWT